MAEGEEMWLLDQQMSNTRKFVNDFVSYVMLTVRDIEWQGDGADEEVTEHFTEEIGDFLMGMSAEERRGYSESIAEIFNKKEFSLSNYSRDFGESFAHLFYLLGYTSSSAIYKLFGYTAEAALAFSEIPKGRGIQVAATALSNFLIHSYLPLFTKLRSMTLISHIRTEVEMYTSAMWDLASYLVHQERKNTEARYKKNEELLREYVIEEVSDEEWEEMKRRWHDEHEILVQHSRGEAAAEEQETCRQQASLTIPPDEKTWTEACSETWRFVADYIAYMGRLRGSTWQWKKGKDPSPYFTNDVGHNLYAITREVRRTYAEELQELYQSEGFDLNKYPELFYDYAMELFRYSHTPPLNMMRVFNMFGYAAEAAAVFSKVERAMDLVTITLSRFIIGVLLRSLVAEGGYRYFVQCLEDMPRRLAEDRDSIEEYRAVLRERRTMMFRATAERQEAKLRELGLPPEKPVPPPKKSQDWNLKQRWENEPQRWFPAQVKIQAEPVILLPGALRH